MSGSGYGNHDQDDKPQAPSGPKDRGTPNKPQGPDGGKDNQSETTPAAYPDDDGGKPDYGSPHRKSEDGGHM